MKLNRLATTPLAILLFTLLAPFTLSQQGTAPAYAKWRSNVPVYIAEANKENLKKLRGIFLDYGEKEEFEHIRVGVKLLSKTFSELNIPHQFEVYADGNHGNLIRQRVETRLLPFFNEKLSFK